jgi:hypothetical protein
MSIYIREEINLEPSAMRKLQFIFNKKERKKIFDECSYYKNIYNAVDDKIILNALINKYVNIKLYKREYMKNDKDFKQHKENIKVAFNGYNLLY